MTHSLEEPERFDRLPREMTEQFRETAQRQLRQNNARLRSWPGRRCEANASRMFVSCPRLPLWLLLAILDSFVFWNNSFGILLFCDKTGQESLHVLPQQFNLRSQPTLEATRIVLASTTVLLGITRWRNWHGTRPWVSTRHVLEKDKTASICRWTPYGIIIIFKFQADEGRHWHSPSLNGHDQPRLFWCNFNDRNELLLQTACPF